MSKKLIAVASAAALALSALVASPAQASTFVVDIDGSSDVASHSSSSSAITIADPMETGTLDNVAAGSSTATVARFVVTTTAAATLAITTTGGLLLTDTLVDSASAALKKGAGTITLAKSTTSSALSYTFYAYTNSTTAGSVVIDSGTTKKTYFIKAPAGQPQNLVDVKWPATVLSGEAASNSNKNAISFQVTDAFGNKLTSGATVTLDAIGVTSGGNATYNSAASKKRWEANVNGAANSSVSMQLTLTAADLTGAGFPAANDVAFSTVSAGSLADQVTALTAQVAALKADYNALAVKFNKKVKKASNKVALK
jgi:hypothetical protein